MPEAYEQLADSEANEIEPGLALGLTPGEATVFAFLLQQFGRPMRRGPLLAAMDHVRGGEVASATILDIHICRIHRKLAGRRKI